MSSKNFLKPFALTVSTLLASTQAQAAVEPQLASAIEHVAQASTVSGMADLTLATSAETMTADAHGSHSSHASHASHASHSSHSSHSSSAY